MWTLNVEYHTLYYRTVLHSIHPQAVPILRKMLRKGVSEPRPHHEIRSHSATDLRQGKRGDCRTPASGGQWEASLLLVSTATQEHVPMLMGLEIETNVDAGFWTVKLAYWNRVVKKRWTAALSSLVKTFSEKTVSQ